MAKLARVLKTDIMGDLTALAALLQSKGRDGDSILAHISPKEAKKLKKMGGRGTRNPDTGLLEFADGPELPEVTVTSEQPSVGFSAPIAQPYESAGTSGFSINPPAYAPSASGAFGMGGYSVPEAAPTAIVPAAPAAPSLAPDLVQRGDQLPDTDKTTGKPKESLWKKGLEAVGGVGGLAQLGLTGLLGIQGQKQARQAAQQAQQYAAQQQAMALPYQVSGQRMATAAERGELTPASRQAYEAARAQMAQAGEARGGVGVAQSATQLEAFRQQLLQNQYSYGLQVANIGDNIALGAIRTGMQADQYVNQATMNFYSMLGNFAAQRGVA